MMYYESDIRMANGEIDLLYKERSFLFFSNYVARLTIQGMSILVSMRVYKKGYGKIMSLVADDDRTDAECLRTKDHIDEYLAVCKAFDAYYLDTNRIARLAIDVRYGRLTILAMILTIMFLWRGILGVGVTLNAICAILCFCLAGIAEIVKGYKIRNNYVDQEYIDNIVENGKRINSDDEDAVPVYVCRSFKPRKKEKKIELRRIK